MSSADEIPSFEVVTPAKDSYFELRLLQPWEVALMEYEKGGFGGMGLRILDEKTIIY